MSSDIDLYDNHSILVVDYSHWFELSSCLWFYNSNLPNIYTTQRLGIDRPSKWQHIQVQGLNIEPSHPLCRAGAVPGDSRDVKWVVAPLKVPKLCIPLR